MGWAWELTTLTGTAVAIVEPQKATIQRALNGASTCVLELTAAQAAQAVHGRLVRGWRTPKAGGAKVLRSHTQITEVNAAVGADSLEAVSISSVDGYGMLGKRNTLASYTYTATSPRGIVYDLVSVEDGRRTVGLDIPATGDSGPNRDRTYEPGKNVGEAVQQLAEVDDGFYFRIDPYQGSYAGYTVFSQFNILYPASGGTSIARFEYGDGTLGNIQSAEVTVLPPVNSINAFGAGEVGSQISTVVDHPYSVALYGLQEEVLSRPEVTDGDTLAQYASDALKSEPQTIYKFKPMAFGPSLPSPWDEFDVGDLIVFRLNGQSPYMQTTQTGRVISFTVEIGQDGVEFLTDLIVEVVNA